MTVTRPRFSPFPCLRAWLHTICFLTFVLWPSLSLAQTLAVHTQVTTKQSTASSSIVSPPITTTQPGLLLVAFLSSDGPPSSPQSYSSVSGGGLNWTLRRRTNVQAGTSEVWQAVSSSPLSDASVTATLSSGSYMQMMTVVVFSGAHTTANGAVGGASAPSGGPTATITTTRAGSWIWGVGNDWDGAVARTVGADQTQVEEFLASVGDTFWVQRRNSTTAASGTAVTLNCTAPTDHRWNLSLIEIPVAVQDTEPPTAPSNLTASATSAQVSLAWTASSDNVGVAGYDIWRSNAVIGTSSGVTYGDATASPNTSYTYRVTARDAAGNVSAPSNTVTITTPPDTTPPTVSITAPAADATVSGTVTVTATASDAGGVAGVQFKLNGVNLGSEDTTAPYSVDWNTTLVPDGSHTLSAVARDIAGNTGTAPNVAVNVGNSAPPNLSVDGSVLFQTIDGFGVNANSLGWNQGDLKSAVDQLIDLQGSRLWRVIVESTINWETNNDNNDPFVFNWTYYNQLYETPKFTALWNLLNHLTQRGQTVCLNIMGYLPNWMGGSRINNEDEWVEMVSSLLYYARFTRGITIKNISPLNESDWGNNEGPLVDPTQYARILKKLGDRLDALNITDVKLFPADTAMISQADDYARVILGDAALMPKVPLFSIHDYGGNSGDIDSIIKTSNYPDRRWWVTEWAAWCGGCDNGTPTSGEWSHARETVRYLFKHLQAGAHGALVYDAYDSWYDHHNAFGYWGQLAYNSTNGTYTPRKRFWALAQVYKFVPPGSVRVRVTTTLSGLELVAFKRPDDGAVTIVGYNASGATRTILGALTNLSTISALSPYQTSPTSDLLKGTDLAVTNGRFALDVPNDTLFTVTGVVPPAPTYSLVAAPESLGPGEPLSVSWTAPPGRPSSDWVGLYKIGAPNTAFIKGKWKYTGGLQSGTFTTTAPLDLGNYEFRYLLQNGYTDTARSNPVAVRPSNPYSVSSDKSTVAPGGTITASWIAPAGRPYDDWVGLFRVGDPNTSYIKGKWKYTQGATSGSFGITMPTTAGQYEIRYLLNNGFTDTARSAPITVSP